MMIRLDKYLSDMGKDTRSRIKKEITKGFVTVNGSVVSRPEFKINTQRDLVCLHGQPVAYKEYEYFMLNKPAGVISATEDKKCHTVVDLICDRARNDLFPVGRLDKDTEGLLLITNDGALAHRLLSPRKHVDKVYYARICGEVTENDVRLFSEGLDIGDEKITLPASLQILACGPESEVLVTLKEGRFHQIKRMFQAVGKEVVYLKRLRMGTLILDENLAPGQYRRLTEQEIKDLC